MTENPTLRFPRLPDVVAALALARQAEQIARDRIESLERSIAATPMAQLLIRERQALADALEDARALDAQVREMALNEHVFTGDKRPHPATTIKLYTVLQYDQGQALDYCRGHLPQALVVTLNAKVFEPVAKAAGLDFVSIRQEPRATIARDLSAWLPVEPEGLAEWQQKQEA